MFFIIALICLILAILYIVSWKDNEVWDKLNALPGPPIYPIIGNTQAIGKSPEGLFNLLISNAKKYGPIYKIKTLNMAIVVLLVPEDIEIVMSSMKHISKGRVYEMLHQWLGTGLLTSTGTKWQQRRKILTPAFHFTILQDFVNIFNRETNNLVDELKKVSGQPIDVLKPITGFTLNSIGETSLGVKMADQLNLREYKNAIFEFGNMFVNILMRPWLRVPFIYKISSVSKEIDKSVKVLHDFSTDIIRQRKEYFEKVENAYSNKKRMALLDLLLKAKNEQGLDIDDEGIREEVDTFMFEGHDTTSLGISYLLVALANEPKWQEEVYEEILAILGDQTSSPSYSQLGELKLTERVIKETLRLYPSVPLITRIASEEFKTTTGYTIPKGVNTNINIFSLHRSPEIWENPEKFNPDRFLLENSSKRHPFSFIPFSAGPRNCIGQKFAILEMKSVLCGIIRNFILEAIDRPEDLTFKADLVLRPSCPLRVKFVPRLNIRK